MTLRMERPSAEGLAGLSDAQLADLERTADTVLNCLEEFALLNSTPVGQILGGAGEFTEGTHYPDGDVHDEETGAQYYYHAHRGSETENGHFHLFVRAGAIPPRMQPAFPSFAKDRPCGTDAIAHIGAVSIGHDSLPKKLFTTNQWVTGETFYSAQDTCELAGRFSLTTEERLTQTSRLLSALVALFLPQIKELLLERDERVVAWAARHPTRDALEDEELEILSQIDIDIDAQIAMIDAEVARREQAIRARESTPNA